MAGPSTSGPRDYLAAERTFLAWIRTGLALMGFGFVVARFGLFLQALQIGHATYQARPYGPSFCFGTALIVLGVAVNIVCARNHVRLVRELNSGGPAIKKPSRHLSLSRRFDTGLAGPGDGRLSDFGARARPATS